MDHLALDVQPMVPALSIVAFDAGIVVVREHRADLASADHDEQSSQGDEGKALNGAAAGVRHQERGRTGTGDLKYGWGSRMVTTVTPLARSFFDRPTLEVAPDLLGRVLVYEHPEDGPLAGRIVETEAYTADDPAMHGWKATFGSDGLVMPFGRAADLFAAPGTAYVYRIYHTNWLLNVVTEPEGTAGAVLIRALEPLAGEEAMTARRPAARRRRDVTNGPGKLTQALGIASGEFHGADLTRPPLYFAAGKPTPEAQIEATSRIGVSRGIERRYRFLVAGNRFVSPGVPSDVRVARKTGRMRDEG